MTHDEWLDRVARLEAKFPLGRLSAQALVTEMFGPCPAPPDVPSPRTPLWVGHSIFGKPVVVGVHVFESGMTVMLDQGRRQLSAEEAERMAAALSEAAAFVRENAPDRVAA